MTYFFIRVKDYGEYTGTGTVERKKIREYIGRVELDFYEDQDEEGLLKVLVVARDASFKIMFKRSYSRVDDKNRFKTGEKYDLNSGLFVILVLKFRLLTDTNEEHFIKENVVEALSTYDGIDVDTLEFLLSDNVDFIDIVTQSD